MDAAFDALLPATRRALEHRLATAQARGRTPSLAAAVLRAGRPVWSGGRGTAAGGSPGDDTQYRIGSLTKTFTAVTVMRLRDEGLLDLGDRLEQHLPGALPDGPTIAQLLAHGAGIASETPGPWWERTPGGLRPDLAAALGPDPVRHPAGRRFHYSNPGYAVLGALVERFRGAPWDEVVRAEVLAPLGMDRTTPAPQAPHADGYAVHPWADVLLPEPHTDTGVMAPAGQLWSTLADLSRWADFLHRGDPRVLGAESVAEMRRPAVPPEGREWDSGYGLGLQLRHEAGRLLHGHTGSMPGFVACLWVDADEDLAAVVLSNVTSGVQVAALAAAMITLVAQAEPRIPEPWRPLDAADPQLLELTGPWYWGAAPFALRLLAGRELDLAPLGGAGRGSRFLADADGTWTGRDGYYAGERLTVVRGADGRVSHLDIGSFVLTRAPYDPAAPVPGGVDPLGWRTG